MSTTETQRLVEHGEAHTFRNYRQPPLVMARGEGPRVFDADGKAYLDLICGIAVNVLGHCHPKLVAALEEQARKLWHTSNLFWTEPAIRLADRLTATCFADRVFFCNSGAEANEAAIKLARRYHHDAGRPRYEIVTFEGGFHGRTFAALAATAQPKYHEGFGPMPAGFKYLPYGDVEALRNRVDESVAAVMLEPIQGESGVVEPPEGFLEAVREVCDATGALLVLDEVQSGIGRTGRLWAHQWTDVVPDVMTSAKGLGGGIPIGACLAREEVAKSLVPGTHASTFGGNPLAAACAVAVLEVLLDEGVLETSVAVAAHLRSRLESLGGPVEGVRGKGMWLGVKVGADAPALVAAAREGGVLVNAIGDAIVRLAPPLNLTIEEVDEAVDRLAAAWNRTS